MEEPAERKTAGRKAGISAMAGGTVRPARLKPAFLDEISVEDADRMETGFKELDRVLGDGIVAGSLDVYKRQLPTRDITTFTISAPTPRTAWTR